MTSEAAGRPLVAGGAAGPALVLADGLSFAMGFDPVGGRISDLHGGSAGTTVTDRVLVMPYGRGSSSASSALAEAIRLGTSPAAIVLGEVDEILAVGAIVARRLYGRTCPVVVLPPTRIGHFIDGQWLAVTADGRVLTDSVAPSSHEQQR